MYIITGVWKWENTSVKLAYVSFDVRLIIFAYPSKKSHIKYYSCSTVLGYDKKTYFKEFLRKIKLWNALKICKYQNTVDIMLGFIDILIVIWISNVDNLVIKMAKLNMYRHLHTFGIWFAYNITYVSTK